MAKKTALLFLLFISCSRKEKIVTELQPIFVECPTPAPTPKPDPIIIYEDCVCTQCELAWESCKQRVDFLELQRCFE